MCLCVSVRGTYWLDQYIVLLYLCNRNSLAELVYFSLIMYLCKRTSLAGLGCFFKLKKLHVPMYFSIVSTLCNRNWTCTFFQFKKNHLFILLMFLLCNRNSLAGLVVFFSFEKKKNLYIYVTETYVTEAGLVIFFRFKKIYIFYLFIVSTFM